MTNKELNKFLILLIFTLTLIFSSNNTVNAGDLCNPCQPGDGGKLRKAGTSYSDRPGEVAGYYYLTGQITMCFSEMNGPCWYIGDNNAVLTQCRCVEPTTDTCQNPNQWSNYKYSYFTRIPEGGCNNGQQKYKKITYYTRQCLTCNCTGSSSYSIVTNEYLSCNQAPPRGCSTSSPGSIRKGTMNLTNSRTGENSYSEGGYGSRINKIDGIQFLDRHIFTWNNGTKWGEGCPTNKSNSLIIRILQKGKQKEYYERQLYFGNYNGQKTLNWVLGDYIPVKYQCNKYYGDWFIKKSNSSRTSTSPSKALYFENMQPEITSVQTQRSGNIVYLSINAEGAYIKNIRILDSNNRPIENINVKKKGSTIKTTSIDLTQVNPNTIKVVAYNDCDEQSNVVTRNFSADIANIKFNLYKFNNVYEQNINVQNINCAAPVSRVSSPSGRIRLGKTTRNIYGIKVTNTQPTLSVNKTWFTNNLPLRINEATVSESGSDCELRLACVNRTKVNNFRITNQNVTAYNLKFAKICISETPEPPIDDDPDGTQPPIDGTPTDGTINISFNIEKFNKLSDDFSCSDDSSSFSDVKGDITLSNQSGYSKGSDDELQGNKLTITEVDKLAFPLDLDTNLSIDTDNSCRQVQLYCVDDKKLDEFSDEGIELEGDQTDLTYTLKFGESEKDSWITIFDGDVYSKNIKELDSCTNDNSNLAFKRGIISTSNDDEKGNIYLEEDEDITNKKGDVIKGLAGKSSSRDLWLNSYVFPNNADNLVPINNIDNVQSDTAYYYNGDLDIDNELNYFDDGISVVYVNGDLSIDNNINSENGFLTFIVNGSITIGNDFGIENYLEQNNYSYSTTENLKVGLVSLSDAGITFQGNDNEDEQDLPLIIKGFVLSKGSIVVNRDLGVNNADYPAVIVNSYSDEFITKVTDFDGNFGLEIYDIQWEYAE